MHIHLIKIHKCHEPEHELSVLERRGNARIDSNRPKGMEGWSKVRGSKLYSWTRGAGFRREGIETAWKHAAGTSGVQLTDNVCT